MNKSQVIGGFICIAIAAFLTVAYFALPENELMFLVGENNIPLAPIILVVVGFLLVITSRRTAKDS